MVVVSVEMWRNHLWVSKHLNLWGVSRSEQVYMGVWADGFPHRFHVERRRRISAFSPSQKRKIYLGMPVEDPPDMGVKETHVLGQKSEFSPGWGIYPQF
jgi:hypothetical protein